MVLRRSNFYLQCPPFKHSNPRSTSVLLSPPPSSFLDENEFPMKPKQVVDVGCKTGESTHFLCLFTNYFDDGRHPIHIHGMDKNVLDIQKAKVKFPQYAFTPSEFFHPDVLDIPPIHIDVLQTSVSLFQRHFPVSIECIKKHLTQHGRLHLHGELSSFTPMQTLKTPYGSSVLFPFLSFLDRREYLILHRSDPSHFLKTLYSIGQSHKMI